MESSSEAELPSSSPVIYYGKIPEIPRMNLIPPHFCCHNLTEIVMLHILRTFLPTSQENSIRGRRVREQFLHCWRVSVKMYVLNRRWIPLHWQRECDEMG